MMPELFETIKYTAELDKEVFEFITDIKAGILANERGNYKEGRKVWLKKYPYFDNFMVKSGQEARPIGNQSIFVSQVALALKSGFLLRHPEREDIANNVLEFVLAIALDRSNDELLNEVGINRERNVICLSEALKGLESENQE